MGLYGKNTNIRMSSPIREALESRATMNGETITAIIKHHTINGLITEMAIDLLKKRGFPFAYKWIQQGMAEPKETGKSPQGQTS